MSHLSHLAALLLGALATYAVLVDSQWQLRADRAAAEAALAEAVTRAEEAEALTDALRRHCAGGAQ